MKASTKKAFKKFGKSFVEGAKEVGGEIYEGTKETLKSSAHGVKEYFTEPTEKPMSSHDIDKAIKLEQLRQLRAKRMTQYQPKTQFQQDINRTQRFSQGAMNSMDNIIPQRTNLATTSKINQAVFRPQPVRRRVLKIKGQKYLDLRPSRRRVSSMLASDALRI